MQISEQVRHLYDLGFDALASLLTEATLIRKTVGSYDPATGTVSTATESTVVKGLLRGIKATEAGPDVLSTDRVFVTRSRYLGGVIPDPETDSLVVNGVSFEIIPPLREDPTRDIVALQIRKMD